MSRIVDIEPLLKKYDGMNEGTEFSPIHFINDLMALEQLPFTEKEELLRVGKGSVKARQGRFVIYDVDWLKENFYTTEEKIYGQPKQPCEDCISRESIKQKIKEHRDFYVNAYGGFSNLPQNDKSRVDEIDNCIAMVVNEPSVTPQRPKGKWIYKYNRVYECYQCGASFDNWANELKYKNYCPNCGSYNGGGEDA